MNSQELLNELMSKNYNELRKKYKQMCYLNGMTYSDDVFNDTYIKVYNILKNKQMKEPTLKGVEKYFFLSFKNNTFLEHKLNNRFQKVDIDEIKSRQDMSEDKEYEHQFNHFAINLILEVIQENFDSLSVRCWRIKRLIKIDNKYLTYDKITKITKIKDAKRRIVEIDNFIKNNINIDELRQYFEKNYV